MENDRERKQVAKALSGKVADAVKKLNQRQRENFALYAQACKKQGVKVGEPIDIMKLIE